MHTHIRLAAALSCLLATPSYAQKATATGTGVGISESTSAAGAVAISGTGGNSSSISQGGNASGGNATGGTANATGGQGGRGGSAKALSTGSNSSSNFTVNNPANTTATVNSNINQSGTVTSRVISSGTTTLRSAPPIAAPSLSAAGLETCLGSASGGVSAVGFGITGGSSIVDEGCQARLDSRTLASYGLKAAAVARLCQRVDIWRSMPDICQQYWPVGMPLPYGIAVAAPLAAPSGTYMSASIRVIDGRDGVEKDCLNYSATRQKCYRWAGEPPMAKRQHTAALTPAKTQSKPNWTRPKEKPAPAVEAIETAAPTPSNQ